VAVYLPGPPHPRYIPDLQRADALISDGWAAKQLPGMLGRPVDDVLKGVDVDVFTPEGPDQRKALGLDGKRVVIIVTRLVPIKNLPLLLAAVAEVKKAAANIALLIVGEGPLQPALEARARELGIAADVKFAGYVPQDRTADFYRSADVFALSSDFDNSPNVVLEAMAAGLPIVSTDVGGLRDYVTPPENGTLTPKGDVQALARGLLEYLANPERAAHVGARNRQDAVERFSWATSAANMRAVYQRVIDDFARRRRRAS
jgi:glycosyltransferase involved in cell wall biosynthesis